MQKQQVSERQEILKQSEYDKNRFTTGWQTFQQLQKEWWEKIEAAEKALKTEQEKGQELLKIMNKQEKETQQTISAQSALVERFKRENGILKSENENYANIKMQELTKQLDRA